MHQARHVHSIRTLFCSLILVTLLFPALAAAESPQKLVARLPGSNQLVVGVDVSTVKTSPLYKETMQWVRSQSNLSELLTLLESEGGFSIERDLVSMAMVSPEVPSSVETAMKIPFTVALSGKFDQKKVNAAIKKNFADLNERKEAKMTVYTTDKHDISFIDDTTLVIVSGLKTYQASSWKGLAAKKSSYNSQFKAIISDVVGKHGMWMLMDSSSMAAVGSKGAKGAKATYSAVAFDTADKLGISLLSHFQDAKIAELAIQETEKLKIEAQSNPMLSMMGLGPLLKNLNIKQDKSKVWITSSMTVVEARSLLSRVRAIAERSQSLQTKPIAPKEVNVKSAPPETGANARPAGKTGAAADFN